jgi:hypothetical protein
MSATGATAIGKLPPLQCHACNVKGLHSAQFSKSQLKKSTDNRKCKTCVKKSISSAGDDAGTWNDAGTGEVVGTTHSAGSSGVRCSFLNKMLHPPPPVFGFTLLLGLKPGYACGPILYLSGVYFRVSAL